MRTDIELHFGDGSYLFKLTLPGIEELQRKAGCGIGALYGRVLRGRYVGQGVSFGTPLEAEYSLADLLETIRQGLIGGGMGRVNGADVTVSAMRANELVATYCYPNAPLVDAWNVAAAILSACIDGFDDPNPQKKREAPAGRRRKAPAAGSTSLEPSPT